MPKRKSPSQQDGEKQPLRRSTRQRTAIPPPSPPPTTETTPPKKKSSASQPTKPKESGKPVTTTKAKDTKKTTSKEEPKPEEKPAGGAKAKKPSPAPAKAKTKTKPKADAEAEGKTDESTSTGRQYWLMKAEPETRIENGVDVRFSIDDLASKKEPEPWDGIRNFVARNNLRAMKKGDLAFFYHSNCKEPGIVGTMEVVQEHSPDLSAHDPKTPYYDPKSSSSDPKWSVVYVEFRSKFDVQIGLKELREMGGPGQPLENMQMLKQSRLSVSKVSEPEWEYLMSVAEEKAKGK